MRKLLLFIVAFALGLLTTYIVYVKTALLEKAEIPASINLCMEEGKENAYPIEGGQIVNIILKGGMPLKHEVRFNRFYKNCTDYSTQEIDVIFFVRTPQFYANWLVWSLPWAGIAYIVRRRNAHSRN